MKRNLFITIKYFCEENKFSIRKKINVSVNGSTNCFDSDKAYTPKILSSKLQLQYRNCKLRTSTYGNIITINCNYGMETYRFFVISKSI